MFAKQIEIFVCMCVILFTVVLISPSPDQEGNKLGRMSGTRDFNNIETHAVIKVLFFSASQGAEGNSRNSDRNINLFPSWSD